MAFYCSQRCMKVDAGAHRSSGECYLLQDALTM